MNSTDFFVRRAGVLLHPTSLPSGMLDDDVERWFDFMVDAGFSVWQVLPLGEPQDGLSPYQCISAFAMNPSLLPEYPAVERELSGYVDFCASNHSWVYDYALFKVLKSMHNNRPWYEWDDEWRHRRQHAMQDVFDIYKDEIAVYTWQQYILHDRWHAIRRAAGERQIRLFGDMPLFVGHDSVDVWSHPENYLLDDDGQMTVVAGVPPDYFSETGQRWGNPHYDWDTMRRANFEWWMSRIEHDLDLFDILRIDHFRGLESAWVIEADCETAVDGYWKEMPGDELLVKVYEDIGHLPIVAEDLGIITEQVTALRKKFQLPGMSVLQFGFDEHEDNPNKPVNIETDQIVYTGTHDNDTTKGWFSALDDMTRSHVTEQLQIKPSEAAADRVVDRLIEEAMKSRASLCVIPMQDCLHLGSDSRMNMPGTTEGNWSWSFDWEQISGDLTNSLNRLIRHTHRMVSHEH